MKIKNITIKLAVVVLFALPAVSCVEEIRFGDSFLDKAPGVATDIDSVFSKAENARYALWNIYSDMYFGLSEKMSSKRPIEYKFDGGVLDELSDSHHSLIGYDGPAKVWYAGAYNAATEDAGSLTCKFPFLKARVWECVRAGWLFVENIDRVPDMTADEKARLKAEAKIIIASRYFDMFRHFGGLPIIDRVYDLTKPTGEIPRATVDGTVKFIVGLLDNAIDTPELPFAISAQDKSAWEGRLTRGGAMALKCKVLHFAASPLFNDSEPYCRESPQEAVEKRQVWYGDFKQSRWQDCVDACKAFFTANLEAGNPYALVQAAGNTDKDVKDNTNGYRVAFRNGYLFRGSSELLITVHCGKYQPNWGKYDNFFIFADRSGKGCVAPTQELVDRFGMKSGEPFTNTDYLQPNNPNNSDPFKDRDPRFYETIMQNAGQWQSQKAELWQGGYHFTGKANTVGDAREWANGYAMYKFITDRQISNKPLQWPYLRMAEVYLIYAEALAETDNLPGALAQVDIVRSRVGLRGLDESNPSLSLTTDKSNLINEILRERSCELTLEDVRFFDMIRRKLAGDFKKPLHKLVIKRKDGIDKPWKGVDESKPFPTQFKYEIVEIDVTTRIWWTPNGFSPKWYLSAMPTKEINKDYGLTQNPGW